MKSGICYPSVGRSAAWTTAMGTNADFPVTNLALIDEPRRPWVSTSATQSIRFVLDAAATIDFIALVHHTAPVGANFYLVLSSGVNPALGDVFSGPLVDFWPAGAAPTKFLATRPYRLAQSYVARSGAILIDGAPNIEIGAVEIGQFWEWKDVAVPREIGIESNATVDGMGGGSAHVTRQWAPRVVSGARETIDQSEADTKVLDFQRDMGLTRSFVWCWDVADPVTWSRESMLVTNDSLPAAVANGFDVSSMAFSFKETL